MSAIPTLTDLVAHTTARAADVDANFAALLAMLDPSSGPDGGVDGTNMQGGLPGQLWIADGSGTFTQRSVAGDVTLSATGQTEIGAGKVGTPEIADGAVTLDKMNLALPNDVYPTTTTVTGSGHVEQIGQVNVTNGVYMVMGSIDLYAAGTSGSGFANVHTVLNFNGSDHESDDMTIAAVQSLVIPVLMPVTITTGAHITLSLKNIGSMNISIRGADTGFPHSRLTVFKVRDDT